MKLLFSLILLFSISYGFAQENADSCKWEVPATVTINCTTGQDYQFDIKCSCSLESYQIKVFNRWGEELYKSTDIEEVWDASETKDGTYFWMIEGKYLEGDQYEFNGTVTVITGK